MKNLVIALVIFSIIGFTSQREKQATTQSKIQILFSGIYRDGEVQSNAKGKWFGLFVGVNGFELNETKVNVETVRDELFGESDTNAGAIEVTTSKNAQPVVLVRGARQLRNGPVKTVFWGRMSLVTNRESSFFLNDSIQYFLVTQGELREGQYIENFSLLLNAYNPHSPYNVRQSIASLKRTDPDGAPAIIWAGDLDRDNKLDLLIDLTNHYNVREPTLFLSSEARAAELVRRVASLRITGC